MTGYLCVHNVECWRCWQHTKKPDKLLGDKLREQNCVFAECGGLLYIFINTGMQNFTPHWCKDSFVKRWRSVRSTLKQNIQRELILWACYSCTLHNTFIWASEMPDKKYYLWTFVLLLMSHDQMFQMVQGVTANSHQAMTTQLSKAKQYDKCFFMFSVSKAFHVWTVFLHLTQKGKKTPSP